MEKGTFPSFLAGWKLGTAAEHLAMAHPQQIAWSTYSQFHPLETRALHGFEEAGTQVVNILNIYVTTD